MVPLKGGIGGIVHPPIGSIYHLYTTYTLPSGGLYATYHLLGEPETTIEKMVGFRAWMTINPYVIQNGETRKPTYKKWWLRTSRQMSQVQRVMVAWVCWCLWWFDGRVSNGQWQVMNITTLWAVGKSTKHGLAKGPEIEVKHLCESRNSCGHDWGNNKHLCPKCCWFRKRRKQSRKPLQ